MKTLILGLDAFDPKIFERLHDDGELPNLSIFVKNHQYSRFQVSNPPQSEVSWTSIATGLSPDEHGIFDFVHRNPENYGLFVSLLPSERGLGGTQFVRPSNARTIFDITADQGYPATALWWPATFPARPESPVRTLPGLGTPDILGRLGVGTLYSSNPEIPNKIGKTPAFQFEMPEAGKYTQELIGPAMKTRSGSRNAILPFSIKNKDNRSAVLSLGKQNIDLTLGQWSPIIELPFKLGFLLSTHVITRAILTQVEPHIQLYLLPLQIHPLNSLWRYGTPTSFVKGTWKNRGPFLTLGWPQDTIGLEDDCISDEQFLELCDSIFETRVDILMHQLANFREGILASVFDTLDRVQHMYLRDNPDVIENWYRKQDRLVGHVMDHISSQGDDTNLIVVSDHGFNEFNFKVHLNRWLIEQGYLSVRTEQDQVTNTGEWKEIDWSRSQAYAIGLNSLYINLSGREGRGIISIGERDALLDKIRNQLLDWRGPDKNNVVQQVWQTHGTNPGPLAPYGPDLVIGYNPGYRGSAETGLGGWKQATIERNNDHWGADHCFDPNSVPGVLFSNQDISNFPNPSYKDIPALSIGAEPDSRGAEPPHSLDDEEYDQMQERLKSLGYL